MARATQDYEILWPFVPVVLVCTVMNIERPVVAGTHLAPVSGSRERLPPPHLPLRLHPVLSEAHFPQLRDPRLLGEASCTALLIELVQPEFGAPPAHQRCGHHLPYPAVADRFYFAVEAAHVHRALREDLLLAVEAPKEEYRLQLGDGPRLSAVNSKRMV